MDLRRLRYFIALSQTRNFGRAAEQLHLSQPGLSQQIKVLERSLGIQLVNRTTNPISFTPAGEALAEQGQRILTDVDDVVRRVRAVALGARPRLRIAYTRAANALTMHAFDIVNAFEASHPEVDVTVSTGWTAYNLSLLRARETDVAFIRAEVSDSEFESLDVVDEELVVIVPASHRLASQPSIRVDEIREEPVVHWSPALGAGYVHSINAQIWGGYPPNVILEQPEPELIVRAVASGLGIAIIDLHRAQTIEATGVCIVRFAAPAPSTTMAIAWLRSEGANPVVEAFRDTALKQRAEWATKSA